MITLKENSMLHHVKETLEGIILGLISLLSFSVTWSTVDNVMKVITFILGSVCTTLAIRYYWRINRTLDKKTNKKV